MRLPILGLAAIALMTATSVEMRLDPGGYVHASATDGVLILYVDSDHALPPVIGTQRVTDGGIIFEPRFPFQPGLRYRAELTLPSGEKVVERFEVPRRDLGPATRVSAIYPTTDVLPENLLKLYIHFSAPMSRGEAYHRIQLLDEAGSAVDLPFLELEQELWDAEGKRLTLLFDPGRIKRGLVPHEQAGLALEAGKSYTLVINRGFLDARGVPLKADFRKSFRVGPEDRTPPDPGTWRVSAPKAGTKDPVIVDFPEPMDRALLERVVTITTPAGQPTVGNIEVSANETRWSLTPFEAWRPNRYVLECQTILEDLAGNSIGRPFEVDVFEKIEDQAVGATVRLPFTPHH